MSLFELCYNNHVEDGAKGEKMLGNVVVESAVSIPSDQVSNFLDDVVAVEKSAWPPELQASKEKFEARFNLFPEGFFVAKKDGKIVGVSTSEITTYSGAVDKTWDEITDNGIIQGTHDPKGEGLYVVSVGVSPDAQGGGVGGRLVNAQKELTERLGLKYLYLGARMPGYDAYCKKNGDVSPEEYLKIKNEKGDTLDPEIRFYERQGLHSAKIIPNFEPDVQSRDHGVVMLWENPPASS